MSAKDIYKAFALVLGYGLIIGGVLVFGEGLEQRIQVLDIVVLCVLFSQFAFFTFFPLVNLSNKEQKEVGMLGIHLFFLNICCVASLAVLVLGICFEWAFKYQLIGQLAVLFVLLTGRMLTFHAGEKVAEVHQKEQAKTERRMDLRQAFELLADRVAISGEVDPALRQRLMTLCDDGRYFSPSDDVKSFALDDEIKRQLNAVDRFLNSPESHKEALQDTVAQLEVLLKQRKRL